MNCKKVGALICSLRRENGMTQKQLADLMRISDKTISKWERGLGCPDISLVNELSAILGVSTENILLGDLDINSSNGGNMRKIKFYHCEECGNILTSTGGGELSCCGRRLLPLAVQPANATHRLDVEIIEDDFYITFPHPMTKAHYISFVAYVSYDRIMFVRLYPEQGGEVRFPKLHGGKLYFFCNIHGLFVND